MIAHWTPERMAKAQPRDLVIDHRGLGYLKAADGSLRPYNHNRPYRLEQVATGARIMAKPPSGGDDTEGPTISDPDRSPEDGDTAGAAVSFLATVTDPSGVKSVDIVIVYPDEVTTQTFAAGDLGDNVYGTELSGFTDGVWGWYVVATDNARRGGNTAISDTTFSLIIDTSGGDPGGDPGGDIVTNSRWTAEGEIQLAAGRILFEMPTIRGRRITWDAYVCSGTTVIDDNTQASVILTAAHCVYDDVAKMFARNALFIPNQDGTTGNATDDNCDNDPIGCFTPGHGVVDANWTTRTFPDNVEWDYAYYVVPGDGPDSLEGKVNGQTIQFPAPTNPGDVTHAMGYSYSDDPFFMYCAEAMAVETTNVNWWLPNCGLSGGSSGGPWIQPMDEETGSGYVISVNSWGYTNQPGMAGPLLDYSAKCVFDQANNENVAANDENVTIEDRGVVVNGCEDQPG